MTEKASKIPLTGQVKLPEDLDRAINREAARLNKFKYEVIQSAWGAYRKSITNSGDSGVANSSPAPDVVNKDPATTEGSDVVSKSLRVSPEERSWLQKLLRVLRSGRPKLVSALESNLVAFVEAADAADKLDTLEAAGVPADIDQGAAGNIPAAAGDHPARSGDPHQDTGFSSRVKDVLRRESEITKTKSGRPRKAG